jgi:aspartate carbamoyltransferase catalytic subunit
MFAHLNVLRKIYVCSPERIEKERCLLNERIEKEMFAHLNVLRKRDVCSTERIEKERCLLT